VKSAADKGRPVDCLVNLTNDGWFHGAAELDQHLVISAFRAVECRTPMLRAVNTGISAIIDGDGVIREPDVFIDGERAGRTSMRDPQTGRWHKQLSAVLVADVPLDGRRTLYVAWGDWFAATCSALCVAMVVAGLAARRRQRQTAAVPISGS
ncbi:MAG: apolipoprotein N-acyltransferase, partial [Planctomycetes bacterium]|nr:apolipoprotein N-acyltransferase [Planctomycetota bacterium]